MRTKPIDPAVLARLATIDATIDEFGRRVFPRGEGPRGAVELWDRTRFGINRLARELRGAPHLRPASANAEPVMLSPELDASALVETLVARSSRAADLYRRLAGELLRRCDWDRSDRYTPGHQAFRALLKPDGMCPACERINEDQRAMVRAIVSALSAPEARVVYRTGAGLCLPHLRIALGIVDDPSASSCLVTHFLRGIESFVAASGEDRDGIERLTGYLGRGKAGR